MHKQGQKDGARAPFFLNLQRCIRIGEKKQKEVRVSFQNDKSQVINEEQKSNNGTSMSNSKMWSDNPAHPRSGALLSEQTHPSDVVVC